jgi:radical SAM protein with 4Fe4S-binding SPASM domain
MFELTYGCNFRCKHCYVPAGYKKRYRNELNREEIFSILDQLQDLGCFYLGFTGGEPFLRKDIFDILWYAKSKGFQIIIYTNGSLIGQDEAQELKQLNLNKIDITIPALNKSAFEHITGIKGSWGKVFRSIELLYKKGVKLGFKTCVLKDNLKEIKNIQDFAISLGALHRLDDRLSPRLDGDTKPYRYRGVSRKSQVTGRRSQVTGLRPQVTIKKDFRECGIIDNYELRATSYELFKCGVGVSQAAITPLGQLKMCVMIDYPRYKILNRGVTSHQSPVTSQKDGLDKAWQKLKDLVAGIKPDNNYQCDNCELSNYCNWCPAKSWLHNKSFTSCDSEIRYWAEQRREEYEYRD